MNFLGGVRFLCTHDGGGGKTCFSEMLSHHLVIFYEETRGVFNCSLWDFLGLWFWPWFLSVMTAFNVIAKIWGQTVSGWIREGRRAIRQSLSDPQNQQIETTHPVHLKINVTVHDSTLTHWTCCKTGQVERFFFFLSPYNSTSTELVGLLGCNDWFTARMSHWLMMLIRLAFIF